MAAAPGEMLSTAVSCFFFWVCSWFVCDEVGASFRFSQRRTQKAAQNLKRPVRSIGGGSRSLQEHDEPESEEGVDSSAEEGPTPQSHGYHRAIHHRHHRPSRGEPFPRLSPIHHGSITALERHQVRRPGYAYRTSPASSSFYRGPAVVSRTTTTPTSVSATRERMVEDDDRDADADGEGESYVEDDRSPSATSARQGPSARRSFPGTCADLDTPHGRYGQYPPLHPSPYT